ncbi:hypothetical protein MKW94_015148 [Papaver nudicaule]|uniref:Agenet domain-containing protein n=1 Tax=Papaver nudicaule TaxID=74823 RepID=A0AA41S5R7_PAPNU|nr:hypothetical protein [Papaver nudicaule]
MAEFRYKFEKGEAVEVMQDEEGFRGSLFEAKVLTARTKNNKVSIQYVHLVEDEETEKPLREYVEISNIRPSPRPNQDVGYRYKLGDLVDCFYEDAWWEGVIKKVKANGTKFDVYFNTSQEEIEFTAQDMRLHREWNSRDGSWNPPQRGVSQQQPHRQLQFVEVAGEGSEYAGSWFTAVIVKRINERQFLVHYQSLNTDSDDRIPLEEEANVERMRPLPPDGLSLMTRDYSKGQAVDVRYKDGWWCSGGVVLEVFSDLRIDVQFRLTGEVVQCYHSQLRLHRVWDSRNGSWIPPLTYLRRSPEPRTCNSLRVQCLL